MFNDITKDMSTSFKVAQHLYEFLHNVIIHSL